MINEKLYLQIKHPNYAKYASIVRCWRKTKVTTS